jgi:hypothetical protein
VDIRVITIASRGGLPARKRTIDSKGSKRSVNGLPRIHPKMTIKLRNGVSATP